MRTDRAIMLRLTLQKANYDRDNEEVLNARDSDKVGELDPMVYCHFS